MRSPYPILTSLSINNSIQFPTIKTKEKSTSHHDKHHVQHLLIIHTSSNNHIKLFTKYFQGYPNLKTIFDKVRLPFYNFKTIETIEPKPSKQTLMPKLCIHLYHI